MIELNCPETEQLAAFIDGRLSGAERRRVLAHLDGCEVCYEVLVESVRFLGTDTDGLRVMRPAASRWGRTKPLIWLPVAAAVIVAIGAAFVLARSNTPTIGAAELLAELSPAGPTDLVDMRWTGWPSAEAGASFMAPSRPDPSFRIGVRLVDLQAAVNEGHADSTSREANEISLLLSRAGLNGAMTQAVNQVLAASGREPAGKLRPAVLRLDRGLDRGLDRDSFALGKWVEAGRLAAASGDAAFFDSPAFVEFERSLRDRPQSLVVTALLDFLTRKPVQPENLEELERLFERVIASH